jgi:hypothetical protein
MSKYKFITVAAMSVLFAASAMATNFRAADQVYVPAVGHFVGSSGTFISDVFISNVSSTDTVSVSVIYCAQGQTCTPQTFPNLITLGPNEHKELVDWVVLPVAQGGLGLTTGNAFGQAVFNGCLAGANVSCGTDTQDANGVSLNFRNISVETRVYAIASGKSLTDIPPPPTSGQLFTGYPWYNFVSQDQAANGLDKVFITGIRQTGLVGAMGTYRSNIGLINASQFSNTTMRLSLYTSTGVLVTPAAGLANPYTVVLGPLGSVQKGITEMFGVTGTGYWATVEQTNSQAIAGAPAGCAPPTSNGCPAFFAYGSVLDNSVVKKDDGVTPNPNAPPGDATTLEPQYFKPLTDVQIACIYPAPSQAACKGTSIMRRAVGK